jgi:hypothetical protein
MLGSAQDNLSVVILAVIFFHGMVLWIGNQVKSTITT